MLPLGLGVGVGGCAHAHRSENTLHNMNCCRKEHRWLSRDRGRYVEGCSNLVKEIATVRQHVLNSVNVRNKHNYYIHKSLGNGNRALLLVPSQLGSQLVSYVKRNSR